MELSREPSAFWLIHDYLPCNSVKLLQFVRLFHVVARATDHDCGPEGPWGQWFLVIEGDSMQTCLSIQPRWDGITGGCGIMTLDILDQPPPEDFLHRQMDYCLDINLAARAVLERLIMGGWHKFKLGKLDSGYLYGQRYHLWGDNTLILLLGLENDAEVLIMY